MSEPVTDPVADDGAPHLDADLAFSHHLLALTADVESEEVEALAVSWFEGAGWRGPRALALAPDAVLTGPWPVREAARAALRLPVDCEQAYLLRCPVLRGAPPPERMAAVDPKGRAFRDGMPFGVESEAVDFLQAAARRLGGVLRVAGSGAVITPDPDGDVNLWVYSPVWLDPEALLAAVRPALPMLELAMDLGDPVVPEVPPPPPAVEGIEPLDEGERQWLHAEARAFDEAVLAQPPVLDAYGAAADLGPDGLIEVAVEGEEAVPLVLRGLSWAEEGVVAYALRWWPSEEDALYDPDPSPEMRAARARARAYVESAAGALHAAVGGEITDESGFLIDPETLVPDAGA